MGSMPMDYYVEFGQDVDVCDDCKDLLSEPLQMPYHVTPRWIMINPNCPICGLIRSRFYDPVRGLPFERVLSHSFVFERVFRETDKACHFRIFVEHGCDWYRKYCEETQKQYASQLNILLVKSTEININQMTAFSTDSQQSHSLIQSWLSQCQNQHLKCRIQCTFCPTRLVDIGSSKIRLVESPSVGEYATLSHCWGQKIIFSLLTTNLQAFRREIRFEDLPRLFQDAVKVARSIGFKYIWIDSICIIQDDEADWSREASLMEEIYSNASCNIAGTGFANSSSGLHGPRDIRPRTITVDRIYGKKTDVQGEKTDVELPAGSYYLIDADCWGRGVESAPLNQRAWVVQERFLSQRTIHFGAEQMFWECAEFVACELFPQGFPDCVETQCRRVNAIGQVGTGPQARSTLSYDLWANIVSVYSRCGLTYESDKMKALHGLKKYLAKEIEGAYLAGLWENLLALQLTWSADLPKKRPAYRAPSWSWASVDGAVSDVFPVIDSYGSYATIKDVWVKYKDDFGTASDGALTISTRLGLLRMFLRQESYDTARYNAFGLRQWRLLHPILDVVLSFDANETEFGTSTATQCESEDIKGYQLLRSWDSNATVSACDKGVLIFAPLLLVEVVEKKVGLRGLILMPTGLVKGQYRRIGSFVVGILRQEFILEFTKSVSDIPNDLYMDKCETSFGTEYTICII